MKWEYCRLTYNRSTQKFEIVSATKTGWQPGSQFQLSSVGPAAQGEVIYQLGQAGWELVTIEAGEWIFKKSA